MKAALQRLFGKAPATPRELIGAQADKATHAIFVAVARYAKIAHEDTISGAMASIVILLVKQLARTDGRAARELCEALAGHCAGEQAHAEILGARAKLRQAEREALR